MPVTTWPPWLLEHVEPARRRRRGAHQQGGQQGGGSRRLPRRAPRPWPRRRCACWPDEATSVIAETRHGLVLAAAGVDSSNVEAGLVPAAPPNPTARLDGCATPSRARRRQRRRRDHRHRRAGLAQRPDRPGDRLRRARPRCIDLSGTTDPYGNVPARDRAGRRRRDRLARRPGQGQDRRPTGGGAPRPGRPRPRAGATTGPAAAELVRPASWICSGSAPARRPSPPRSAPTRVALAHFPPRVAATRRRSRVLATARSEASALDVALERRRRGAGACVVCGRRRTTRSCCAGRVVGTLRGARRGIPPGPRRPRLRWRTCLTDPDDAGWHARRTSTPGSSCRRLSPTSDRTRKVLNTGEQVRTRTANDARWSSRCARRRAPRNAVAR